MEEVKKETTDIKEPIRMLVELFPDGRLNVSCSMLKNKIFMYGLIKMTELAVISHQVTESNIIERLKDGGIVNFARNIKKRF